MTDDKTNFTTYLPSELLRDFSRICRLRNFKRSDAAEEIIREYVERVDNRELLAAWRNEK